MNSADTNINPSYFDAVANKLQQHERLSPKDIISLGIVKSHSTLARWRKSGQGPSCLRIENRFFYEKRTFLLWLENQQVPKEKHTDISEATAFILEKLEKRVKELEKWKELVDIALAELYNQIEK